MAIADHLRAAERSLAAYGEPLTLQIPNRGTYDETTRSYPDATDPTEIEFRGFVAPFSVRDADGDSVRIGDLKVIAAGSAFDATEPKNGHTIVRGTTAYRIERADLRGAAGTSLRWEIQMRGMEA